MDAQPDEACEQRARQAAAAAAAAHAAHVEEGSMRVEVQDVESRTVSPEGIDVADQPLSPSKGSRSEPSKPRRCQRLQDCFAALRPSQHSLKAWFGQEPPASSGQSQIQEVAVVLVGVAAAACLVAAIADKPKPLAAVLAAGLGWLAMYAYMLQAECKRLSNFLTSGRPLSSQPISPLPVAEHLSSGVSPGGLGHELDLAGCVGAFGLMQRDPATGGVVQSVLTASLVNEYLRLAAALRVYRERHGPLPQGSPGFDAAGLGLAEALLGASGAKAPAQDLATQRSTGEADVSGLGELRQAPVVAPAAANTAVSIESPSPSPATLAPASSSNEGPAVTPDFLSKTVASIEDSVTLPAWLRQIRH